MSLIDRLGKLRATATELVGKKPLVTFIEFRGIIRADDSNKSTREGSGISFSRYSDIIGRAFQPKNLAAVALIINSPGGSPAQSQLITNQIRRLANEKKVPVYAFAEDVAASGGYWLALAADEIYCPQTSMIGSIGVIFNTINVHELASRYGVKGVIVKAGENKARLNLLEEVTDEDKQSVQKLVDAVHELFKAWVLERRGNKLTAESEIVFSADVWTGKTALDMGLVDGNDGPTEVLKQKFGKFRNKRMKLPSTRSGPIRRLLGMTSPYRPPNASEIVDEILTRASVTDFRIG
jgi:signal peptide peptidase SppA